jgi:hypothetical protein
MAAAKKTTVKSVPEVVSSAKNTRKTRADKPHIAVVSDAMDVTKYVSPVHPHAAAATADMQMNAEPGDTVHLFKLVKSGSLKTKVSIG